MQIALRIAVLLAVVVPACAAAQTPLDRGSQLIEQGEFEKALDVLLPDYAQNPNASVAYAIGRAYDGLRDDPMALRFYGSALDLRPGLEREARRRIQERVKALKTRLKDRPKKATLTVRAAADGATVWLDGEQIGRTPLAGVLVPPGSHRVRVVHEHFDAWETSVTLQPYESVTLEAQLLDRPTDVLIHTEPAGATAQIQTASGAPAGPPVECITPCLVPLRGGEYALVLQRDGFAPIRHLFTKGAGQIQEVRINLAGGGVVTPSAAPGSLHALVTPSGAEIRVDGVLRGTAPLASPIPLSPGIHDVAVSAPGYATYTTRVQIAPGPPNTLSIALTPAATAAPVFVPRPVTPGVTPVTPVPGVPVVPGFPPPGEPIDPGPPATWRQPTGWSLLGVGIAAALAGTAVAVAIPITNEHQIDNATRFKLPDGTLSISGITRVDALKLEDRAQTATVAGAAVAGVGAALIIAGAVILALDDAPEEPPSGTWPDGRRNFAPPSASIVPWWTDQGGGASAVLQF